jgi:hypothetical protein
MSHEPDPICRRNAPGALEIALTDTRERAEAIRRGSSIFASSKPAAEIEALRLHARAAGLRDRFELLVCEPDNFGYEHQVWFLDCDPEPWVLKATYADAFGHLPDGRDCLPTEYLERLLLQNEVFGDDIRLEGVVHEAIHSCRIVTSQPAVRGRFAEPAEVAEFFMTRGFESVRHHGRMLWWRRADDILCADTHGGNILVTPEGAMAAIDVPVMRDPCFYARPSG